MPKTVKFDSIFVNHKKRRKLYRREKRSECLKKKNECEERRERGDVGLRFVNQLLREESGGWREGSCEDKCTLSFQRERNPLLETHIYTDKEAGEPKIKEISGVDHG